MIRPVTRRLTIGVIAPLRHALGEPHAGGIESMLWGRIRTLRGRGHRVLLAAPEGSSPAPEPALTLPRTLWTTGSPATDVTYPPGHLELASEALHRSMDWFAERRAAIDVIDNHNLHGVPLARVHDVGIPMVTTLHTPPLPSMLDAIGGLSSSPLSSFLSVSGHTRAEWAAAGVPSAILHNAVDTSTWRLGRGGPDLVWFGRVVPEKAPHLAILAARMAGRRIQLAGRIGDQDYFDQAIRPLLGDQARYVGPLTAARLARLVGGSAVALVTPVWDEPFGLVIAEALSTGTPVVAFDTGGTAEVIGQNPGGRLVTMGDAVGLASAVADLETHSGMHARRRIRSDAVRRFAIGHHVARLEHVLRAAAESASVGAGILAELDRLREGSIETSR